MATSKGFPIDRTNTEFYTPLHLRNSLLHHPNAVRDKTAIYVESASYCRQNQPNGREFIIFNLKKTDADSDAPTVLLLDQLSYRHSARQSLSSLDGHSDQCLPTFMSIFGFLKPSYWRSLKEPGRFYIPNEGCLEHVLNSRGLSGYVVVDKIAFNDVRSLDLEHLISWISTASTPRTFFAKRIAQRPCWFATVLWNAISCIYQPDRKPAHGIQIIDDKNLEKLFDQVDKEITQFRNELNSIQAASCLYRTISVTDTNNTTFSNRKRPE
ncbi:unnamed protein product [Rhizoctonia solani]|uniref:Uncharacterized protein n=1 Tax=Rhizoctonia solani TaxID=456999 RepID=A0A8H2XH13_9AGAM|nr:unnamed protein product [Rhizoctonia solani]